MLVQQASIFDESVIMVTQSASTANILVITCSFCELKSFFVFKFMYEIEMLSRCYFWYSHYFPKISGPHT